MAHGELTIADVLKDPLIRQMMRADRASLKEMKTLLQDAAERGTVERRDNLSGRLKPSRQI